MLDCCFINHDVHFVALRFFYLIYHKVIVEMAELKPINLSKSIISYFETMILFQNFGKDWNLFVVFVFGGKNIIDQ